MEARITALYRYPIKGFSPEPLQRADLAPGQPLPFDRAYAIENGPSGFDAAAPGYLPKNRFLMLMKNEAVARLTSRFDPATTLLTLDEDGGRVAEGRLGEAAGRQAIEVFVARRFATELRGAPRILSAPGHSFSDVAARVVHMVNLASVRDLERHVGRPVDPLRFRANLYVDGLPPWSELDLVGRSLQADVVGLKATKRTMRCAATNVDPATGVRDLEIPRTLMGAYGHTDCGIYLTVVTGGPLAVGERLRLEPPAPATGDLPF